MSAAWLYLFSSNIRHLYEQDVIDLLAAPDGTLYRFRYEQKYLGDSGEGQESVLRAVGGDGQSVTRSRDADREDESVQESLFSRWKRNGLVGTNVIVLYSIQQPEGYHPSGFIPVRTGMVRRTGADGSICYIDFEVREYAPLSPTDDLDGVLTGVKTTGTGGVGLGYGDQWRRLAIRDFGDALRKWLQQHPDTLPRGRSAVLGQSPTEFGRTAQPEEDIGGDGATWSLVLSNSQAAWQLVVEALARTLSFRDELMLRFVSLSPDMWVNLDEDGVFSIKERRTYDLTFTHYHPSVPADVMEYHMAADAEIVRFIGNSKIPIGSRYDTKSVALHAGSVRSVRETVLSLEPSEPFQGAALRLRLRVKPDKTKNAVIAAGTATALVLVALPGILGTAVGEGVRVAFAVAGAGLAAFMAAFGWTRS